MIAVSSSVMNNMLFLIKPLEGYFFCRSSTCYNTPLAL